MNIISEAQGTAEWFAVRIGCLTASRVADIIAKRKNGSGELKSRSDLKLALAVERITNKPMETFVTQWMERGVELEPLARAAYELRTGLETQQVGFVLHPSIKWAGASPDGLVGEHGLVEFKVPKSTTHAEYILGKTVPEMYVPQMQWQMACTGRAWCDFVSYCPDFPEPLDLFICRLSRDYEQVAAMEVEACKFLGEVEGLEIRLKGGLEAALAHSIAAQKEENR